MLLRMVVGHPTELEVVQVVGLAQFQGEKLPVFWEYCS